MEEYEQQANKFLKDTNTEFKAEFLKNGLHFQDDKEARDIYLITLKKGDREFKFNYGNSLNNSLRFKIMPGYLDDEIKQKIEKKGLSFIGCNTKEELKKISLFFIGMGNFWKENKDFKEPLAYDVLACLQSYEVGSFKDFCGDFGYDDDSIKAEKIYQAVLNEYNNLKMLYSDEELLKLQEIQ